MRPLCMICSHLQVLFLFRMGYSDSGKKCHSMGRKLQLNVVNRIVVWRRGKAGSQCGLRARGQKSAVQDPSRSRLRRWLKRDSWTYAAPLSRAVRLRPALRPATAALGSLEETVLAIRLAAAGDGCNSKSNQSASTPNTLCRGGPSLVLTTGLKSKYSTFEVLLASVIRNLLKVSTRSMTIFQVNALYSLFNRSKPRSWSKIFPRNGP
jgi:hypothetical protein